MAQNKIHEFFDANNGKEFIHFGTEQYQYDIKGRYDAYHFFSKYLGRNRKEPWVTLETYSLAIQRRLKISRGEKSGLKYYGGAQWFSITGEFAEYIVENFYKVYWKHFRFGQILDEYAMQTIIVNSPFKDNLYLKGLSDDYRGCMRYIDWERGTPYVFRSEDFEDLINSGYLFARKFDEKVDREIIERLYNRLSSSE